MASPQEPSPATLDAPRVALGPAIVRLRTAVKAARVDPSPECVHQLRSALARTDVWLLLGELPKPRGDLKWLRARAAAVRDLDVQLAMGLPAPVASRLRRRRTTAQRRLREALTSQRLTGLMRVLKALEPLANELVMRGIGRMAARCLKRGRRAMKRPDDHEALHALRRSVRRVRYAVEWAGRSTQGMARLQEALGKAADRAVAWNTLRDAPGDSREIRTFRRALKGSLRRKAKRARAMWKSLRPAFKRLA